MPVFAVSFKFGQTFDGLFKKFVDFAKKWHFPKNLQLTTSFFCHLVQNVCQTFDKFFLNSQFQPKFLFLLIINRQFSQSFDESLPNFATFVIFVKLTIIDMSVSSSYFDFYQTFNTFLPNLSFSENSQLSTCLVCHHI